MGLVVSLFIPQIFILFLFLSILEESGYMPRAAFVMDNWCIILDYMGNRFFLCWLVLDVTFLLLWALEFSNDEKDRLTTIMIIPLMSCNARLPVYIMLSVAFFAGKSGVGNFLGSYIIGILLSIVMASFLDLLFLKGKDSPFVMELPAV